MVAVGVGVAVAIVVAVVVAVGVDEGRWVMAPHTIEVRDVEEGGYVGGGTRSHERSTSPAMPGARPWAECCHAAQSVHGAGTVAASALVGRGAICDVFPWKHDLPKATLPKATKP